MVQFPIMKDWSQSPFDAKPGTEKSARVRHKKLLSNSDRHLFQCRGFMPLSSAGDATGNRTRHKGVDNSLQTISESPTSVTRVSSDSASTASFRSASPQNQITIRKERRRNSFSAVSSSSTGNSVGAPSGYPVLKRSTSMRRKSTSLSTASRTDSSSASVVVQERIIVVTPKIKITRTSPSPDGFGDTPDMMTKELAQIANSIKPITPYNAAHPQPALESESSTNAPARRSKSQVNYVCHLDCSSSY